MRFQILLASQLFVVIIGVIQKTCRYGLRKHALEAFIQKGVEWG